MSNIRHYLRDELRRYFPDCRGIDVAIVDDEHYTIGIKLPVCGIINLTMDVGSDDDCFRFTSETGTIYTVPFPPEASHG